MAGAPRFERRSFASKARHLECRVLPLHHAPINRRERPAYGAIIPDMHLGSYILASKDCLSSQPIKRHGYVVGTWNLPLVSRKGFEPSLGDP